MRYLDLTLPHPAQNLALDEALLDELDGANAGVGVLRVWRPGSPFVVIGRSSKLEREVQVEVCRERDVPVLRRCSGGASIVTGPGCLMYAVAVRLAEYPQAVHIDGAHELVLGRLKEALQTLDQPTERLGTSDLVIGQRKFSGNSLRCKRNALLYHGTLLLDFDLSLIDTLLQHPPREPDYRKQRAHRDFVCNLGLDPDDVAEALRVTWNADSSAEWPLAATDQLTATRYNDRRWTELGRRGPS